MSEQKYAFDCVECFKTLQLTKQRYEDHYKGYDKCLVCRPFDTELVDLPKAIETTEILNEVKADKDLILTEEDLERIRYKYTQSHFGGRNSYSIIDSEIAGLIASHRLLIAANAELSFEKNAYKKALSKIVCLNIPMPDEVFNLANNALEEFK